MKHDYVLTVRFSTKRPIDRMARIISADLTMGVANAIREAFDICHLTIKSFCLKTDEQSLAEQDADGNWRLRKEGANNDT